MDENKNRANRAKHGIDFDFAREAFDDPFAITTQDRDVDGEQRHQLIGAIFTRIILVAYAAHMKSRIGAIPTGVSLTGVNQADADPDALVIRIISARKATPAERKLYEENAAN